MSGIQRLGALAALVALSPCMGRCDSLTQKLRELDAAVFPARGEETRRLPGMLSRDVKDRLQATNQRETKAWNTIAAQTKAGWERYRDARLQALRTSLGAFPPVPRDLKVRVTRTIQGDGYRVENLVFESRPGLVVTANLYRPARPPKSMPGILICHSHHNPKTQGELQDMGMTWARLGCLVLVMDQLGHGERRQHPFRSAKDYPRPFAAGRQDYYFRYNVGIQLHLAGDSLMGWMVWDLMRGVDVLLSRPGVDRERIILLGAVAGGGDPAAVTAALDRRITAVVPFNFGGPQPETTYPLRPEAATTFNYAGSGSWESTRNLRLSARDGFLPWVIIGAAAPRRLVYAHEFAWDRDHDPVWARLEKIYGFYGARDRLAETHGRGSVRGKPPDSTHCNNIGPEHRKQVYAAFKRWFNMPVPEPEYRRRRPAEELTCMTADVARELKPRPVHELVARLGAERADAARRRLAELPAAKRRLALRRDWARLLGGVEPSGKPKATAGGSERLGTVTVERIVLPVERDILVPLVLLRPAARGKAKPAVVIALAQGDKQRFLRERPEVIARLLAGGVAVCLPDVRGVGETSPGSARGRSGASTALSSSELMLGQTLLGGRLRDLSAVLRYLRSRADLDGGRVALWGDSFAPANPPDRKLEVPLDAGQLPDQAEPLGGLLALFGALFDEQVRAVYVHGGLTGYHSVLHSPFSYVPHDIVVPGALTAGDLCDVAASLAPRPLRLEGLVDGLNRQATAEVLGKTYEPARTAYRSAKAAEHFFISTARGSDGTVADWLLAQLK
jgi:dienelactone hydrolase